MKFWLHGLLTTMGMLLVLMSLPGQLVALNNRFVEVNGFTVH